MPPAPTDNVLEFGSVRISWPGHFHFPVAINHRKLNGDKFLITQCPITYRWGELHKTVWSDFLFDGASVPAIVRLVPGYHKIGWHLFAALIHDFSCDFPRELPRPIGDGMFRALLLEIAAHSRGSAKFKRRYQAWAMSAAVSLWTAVQGIRGVDVLGDVGK